MINTEFIYNRIKDFADSNLDLNGRVFFIPKYDQIDTIREYPAMSVEYTKGRILANNNNWFGYIENTISVSVMDKILSDRSNQLSTISDCESIIYNLIGSFSNQLNLIIRDVFITANYQQHDAIVSKVTAEITFRWDFRYNICNIPNVE